MNKVFFKRFSEYEDILLDRYRKHALFKTISSLSKEEFLHVLLQYGEGISANFVKFLETALRQIKNKSAERAMLNILRDEIPQSGPTHQQLRTRSLERIGISSIDLVAITLTPETKAVVEMYFDVICGPEWNWQNRDLAITAFVRVIGESLVGVVYKAFTEEIIRRFGVTEDEIEFYSFHWHHDEKGGQPVDGEHGHTEYYDVAMEDLLRTEEDLEEAKMAADLALAIRCKFQDQFLNQKEEKN